jgi:hypothetical protein
MRLDGGKAALLLCCKPKLRNMLLDGNVINQDEAGREAKTPCFTVLSTFYIWQAVRWCCLSNKINLRKSSAGWKIISLPSVSISRFDNRRKAGWNLSEEMAKKRSVEWVDKIRRVGLTKTEIKLTLCLWVFLHFSTFVSHSSASFIDGWRKDRKSWRILQTFLI